jgi:hypothetical protein
MASPTSLKGFTMQTKTTSRRAVLAGIATAPALAASTLTLAGATALSHQASLSTADAELIALGRVHADLRAKYELARELSEPRETAYGVELEALSKRFGGRRASDAEYEAELIKIGERLDRDFPEPSPSWEDACDLMCPIEKKIMALPASTLQGLAVKARVAKSACDTYWDESEDDCDYDKRMARLLIDAVLSFEAVS